MECAVGRCGLVPHTNHGDPALFDWASQLRRGMFTVVREGNLVWRIKRGKERMLRAGA